MTIYAGSISKALSSLRYLNRLKTVSDPDYLGSSLEADALEGIATLEELKKRMTESNRSDFIGGEL